MAGVVCGCALSALVSTLVLPTTASRASLLHLRASLAALAALDGCVWGGYSAALGSLPAGGATPPGSKRAGPSADGAADTPLPGGCAGELPRRSAVPQAQQQQVDARLDAVLAALREAQDNAAAARREVFLGRLLRGRLLVFLPAPPEWVQHEPRQLAPPAAVADVVAACRACSRVLWVLHSALAPGFPPRQLAHLAGLHGLDRLQALPAVAAAALRRCLEHLDAALGAMEGRRATHKAEDAAALEDAAPAAACSDPAAAAQAAVAELAGAVAALVGGSQANREALRQVLAAQQVMAEQLQAAGGVPGGESCADGPAACADAAPCQTQPQAPASQPGWHDLAGEGLHSLLRWHTVEYLLERLAQRAAQLQRAVAALAAALPA